jgi:predicted nucleic acid-binding protein
MTRVFWDTNLFIYFFEGHADFGKPTRALWRTHHERGDQLVTSWMTVAEIQIKPQKMGDTKLGAMYKQAILRSAEVAQFAEAAAESYLRLRATTAIKGPDAIQLAIAAAANVELFITNDQRLAKLKVPGIHFITSLDRLPF